MTHKIVKIFSLGIFILLLASLFAWPAPVSAGECVWSAEIIPSRLDNILGPAGIDIRDLAIANDALTVYAAPGDSIADNVTYKTTDGGIKWVALWAPIRVDFIAIAPDDDNLIAIANNVTPEVFFSTSGGQGWQTLGTVREPPASPLPAAIFDLAVSPVRNNLRYIAVAGKQAGNIANLWYYDLGAVAATWHEAVKPLNGFSTASEVATLAFSPNFLLDATVLAITDNATSNVTFQMLKIEAKLWNNAAGFADFPRTIVNNAGLNRLASASLAFIPDYNSNDTDTWRVLFGLTVDGDASANATSGIYRLKDAILTSILLDTKIHSIAYDGSYLIAGSDNTNTVYRSADPFALAPTISRSDITKSPGGDNQTVVAWMGGSVVTGTSGDESAFAISEDHGITFNDISLIDTAISIARDVAVSGDGNKVYLVSENGTDTSVWCFDTVWQRVLSQRGTTNFIVRTALSNSNIVYLAARGTTIIYYNNASGTAPWLSRTCNVTIQDMAVESPRVIYAIDATGTACKNIDNGLIWTNINATGLASGATIVSVNTNTILAGSQDGFVAYSLDGGASWTRISRMVEPGAGRIQVVADEGFADNKIIYAASDTPNGSIMKWTIGANTTTAWTDIFDGTIVGGIYGMAISNNILYALEYNAISGQSTLWRHLSPATAVITLTEWTASSTNATTDLTDATVRLNAVPQALKVSTAKLWAVKTNGTNKLYSYTDVIGDTQVALLYPKEGYLVPVNPINTIPYDVTFSWERPSVATGYELLIATDERFVTRVATIFVNMPYEIAYVTVGPNQVGANRVNFTYGTTYYWKVRTTQPGFSRYSEIRSFIIEPLQALILGPNIIQTRGVITPGENLTFSWDPLQGIVEYQFMLSDNQPMISPIVDTLVESTAIKVYVTLEAGKTYFWKVRATQPVFSEWSALGTFNVLEAAETLPPVIVKEGEAATISFTAPPMPFLSIFTSGYLPLLIFIVVMLLAVTITLIIFRRLPTRLSALITGEESPPSPDQQTRTPGAPPPKPPKKPEPGAEIPGTPPKPEPAVPPPTLIELDKEGAAVIFAAKSFMWMVTQGEKTGEIQAGLSEKERQSLGKNLTAKIHDLTKKENLYIKYPEDAPMLLNIWAEYGSRNETNDYLVKTFEAKPDNAIRLLNCYLPAAQPGREPPSADDFTMAQYDEIAKVVDPDKIYAALTKVFKFKVDTIEEITPVKPADRNLAFQFMRLHFKAKGEG